VCAHANRIAIDAALQSGRPLRTVAADYPGLSKSALDRHRKRCGCLVADVEPDRTVASASPALQAVRRRSRPQTDEAERFAIALRMKARGCGRAEIGRALNIHPNTVTDLLNRANAAALERVRSETVEDLIVQRRAERDARAQRLHAILERAELRGDVRTQLDALRDLRHESKEDREWMRELGAFDSFRVPTMQEQDLQQGSDLSRYAREFLEQSARLLAADPETDICPATGGTSP